ncbi:MAG: hypothetical protein V4808_01740 [Pseudomonadota bacterium]
MSLTMKQGIRPQDEPASATEYLAAEKASQNFRHFMNVLNRSALSRRSYRQGVRLSVIPVLEGGNHKRLHYHAVIDCPDEELRGRFPSKIESAWAETKWGYHQIDIQSAADSGWINYISKLKDKPNYADSIDWENYHVSD